MAAQIFPRSLRRNVDIRSLREFRGGRIDFTMSISRCSSTYRFVSHNGDYTCFEQGLLVVPIFSSLMHIFFLGSPLRTWPRHLKPIV